MNKFVLLKEVLGNFRFTRYGKCNICGNYSIFICRNKNSLRNYMLCLFCRSSSRKRHVALAICNTRNYDPKVNSIKELQKVRDIFIYNTDTNDAFYRVLKKNENYVSSLFSPNLKNGEKISERVFCQNIENLTFENDSFDIVITEDVLEHVRDYKKGLREIFRVLKKGGVHIFTIPFLFNAKTIVRIDTTTNEDIHLLPPEYHGDKIRNRIITYRTFGIDLFDTLNEIGFETRVEQSGPEHKVNGIYDSFVFISKKL
jgi:SAM-dependent methyltransferase